MIDWPRGKDGKLDPPEPDEQGETDQERLAGRLRRQGWPEHRVQAELARVEAVREAADNPLGTVQLGW